MTINKNQYYSTSSAAKLCQVSRGSVLRWIREGRLKAAATVGGHHRIQSSDLLNLIRRLGLPYSESEFTGLPVRRLLIVEDNRDICRLIERGIRDFPGKIICRAAHDGLQAGWLLSQFIPDIVFLDLHLPHENGYAVCELLRKETAFQNTKIIAISDFNSEEKEQILKMGADYFLSKPFKWQEARAVIEHELRRGISEKKG